MVFQKFISLYILFPLSSYRVLILTELFMQAAKILANLIVMGGGILARAVVQAYRQALTSKFYKLVTLDRFVICVKGISAC